MTNCIQIGLEFIAQLYAKIESRFSSEIEPQFSKLNLSLK